MHTEPRLTCLGLWLALQDATLDNGCIWARPGSHKEGLRRRFNRNPDYFEKGNENAAMMVFQELDEPAVKWEGQLPEGTPLDEACKNAGFVPYPCKAGDLVLIHGQVDHCSLPNNSKESRHTYQLHLIEGPTQGIKWSETNWLQLKKTEEGKPKDFPKLDSGIKAA